MTSPAEIQRILRARARKLAEVPGRDEDQAQKGGLKLLEFRLAQESYALEERWVQEVQPLKQLTALPCTPAFVRGVVNLRGHILPVLDLRLYLRLPEKGVTDLHQIIFVRGNGLDFGLLADVVTGVQIVPLTRIRQAPPVLAELAGASLKGMTEDRVLVLDMDRILADPGIVVEEVVET